MTIDRSDIIQIDTRESYRRSYKMRKVDPGDKSRKSVTTFLPSPVVEKAATAKGMSIEEFVDQYEVEFLYDGIEGGFFRFVKSDSPREKEPKEVIN